MSVTTGTQPTSTERRSGAVSLRSFGLVSAGSAATLALISGIAHGFGKDDETMVGTMHITLGHALPAVAFAAMLCWIGALWALAPATEKGPISAPAYAAAVLGTVLWAGEALAHSLVPYVVYRINPAVAVQVMKSAAGLGQAFFAASILTFIAGTATFLAGAARRSLVPSPAIVLIILGGLGSFLVGPIGDALLAIGLIWAATRLRPTS